jgi:hypothetical protein
VRARKIYFNHIPKTAGLTLGHWLSSQPDQRVLPARLWSELISIPRNQVADCNLYWGHFYRPFHRFVEEEVDTIVVVRNPIERTLSHFEHIRRAPEHYFHKRIRDHNSVLEFVTDPLTRPMVENFQIRMICNQYDIQSVVADVAERSSAMFALEQQIESFPLQFGDSNALTVAKDYLMRARFVGITSEISVLVERISRAYGWILPDRLESLNIATSRVTRVDWLSSAELSAIVEATRLDWSLYEFARGIV